jgi:hypothetical protein
LAIADEKYNLPSLALFPSHYIAHPALPGVGHVSGCADFVLGSTVGNKEASEADCQPDKMSLLVVVSMTAGENQYNDNYALFLSQLLTVQYLNGSAPELMSCCSYRLGQVPMHRPACSQMESLGICTSVTRSSRKMFCIECPSGIRRVTGPGKTEY